MVKFYGLSLSQVENMSVVIFKKHKDAMDRMEAQEMLKKLKASIYPNLKEDAQSRTHREILKKAFPVKKVHSFDDIEKALGL